MHGIVTAADVQDRDGGRALLATLFGLFPELSREIVRRVAPIRGRSFTAPWPASCPISRLEIVKRSDRVKGFVVEAQALGGRTHHRLAQPLPSMAKD